MILGHYATALIPYARLKKSPLWLLLLSSNFQDFLWLILAIFQVEAPTPASMWEATFQNLQVDMVYSHNEVTSVLTTVIFMVVVYFFYRDTTLAVWCGVLAFAHQLCDLLSGFEHEVLGPGTPKIGLNLYHSAPYLALFIEAALGAICVYWYAQTVRRQGHPLFRWQQMSLYLIFIGGTLIWLPTGTIPLGQIFGVK